MINAIGPVPSPLDSQSVFNTKAFNLLSQLPGFAEEANATAAEMQTNADVAAALITAMALPQFMGTSTSSLAIGTGAKSFATQAGKEWVVGQVVIASSGSNYMKGQVSAYNIGTGALDVLVGSVSGSGTFASWTIGLGYEGLLLVSKGAVSGSGLTQATARLLGRTTVGFGPIEELSVGSSLSLLAGVLALANGGVLASHLSGNQSGSAPALAIRGWAMVDGTLFGTMAPLAGANITSVTRNAAGDYTLNIATAMPTANFAVVGMGSQSSGNAPFVVAKEAGTAFTTTTARITTTQGSVRSDINPFFVFLIG